jgi:hypothetical protein
MEVERGHRLPAGLAVHLQHRQSLRIEFLLHGFGDTKV